MASWDEAVAEWYVRNYGDHATNRTIVELLELEMDDVVVDLGCGSGEAVREAAHRVARGRAIGIDPSTAMLRFATKLSGSHLGDACIEFPKGSEERVTLPDGTARFVTAINSLHHWDDVRAGLAEVWRILRPDSQFLGLREEVGSGMSGHPKGQLADPAVVVRTIEEAGFCDVHLKRISEGGINMLTTVA